MTKNGTVFTFHQDWWLADVKPEVIDRLSSHLSVSPLIARILAGRKVEGIQEARNYLHPSLDQLHDPFILPDMAKAVRRIHKAIDKREPMIIYGHDDVDGMTSALVLEAVVKHLGGNISTYIPNRVAEGIGVSRINMDRLAQQGKRLIVTVDCGIEDKDLLNGAKQLPVDVIVTDHHEVSRPLPSSIPFVNPKRSDSRYPFQDLAGAGVSLKVAQALMEKEENNLSRFFQNIGDLVVLGTLADKVPLIDENRILSKMGFALLQTHPRIGLQAIVGLFEEVSSANQRFLMRRVIPILSSAISIQGQNDGFDLLNTSDITRAVQLARGLFETSQQWQLTMKASFQRMLKEVEEEKAEDDIIVVIDDQTPLTALGTCASRLMRACRRPTFILGFSGDYYVGEGRCPRGWNIMELLEQCRDLFINYGGHKQAAGFSIFPENLNDLQERLRALSKGGARPSQSFRRIDAELDISDIDREVLHDLEMLAPFGRGNPSPMFLSRKVELLSPQGDEFRDEMAMLQTRSGIPVAMPPYYIQGSLIGTLIPGTRYDIIYHLLSLDKHSFQINVDDLKKAS